MPEEIAGLAGTGAVGAGDGGGAGAAIAEPSAEAIEEVVESPAEGAGEAAPAEPAEGGAAPEAEGTAEGEGDELEADGRKIDAKTRAAIATLKKTDPVAAKAVKDAYFSNQAVLKEFPEAKSIGDAIREIRLAKATLESVGGEQGIADLNQELTEWRGEAEQFAAGDPKLIEKLYEANPEALVTTTQNSLATLKAKDGKLFDQAILPSIVERLEQVGLNGSLQKLAAFIKEGKGQESYDLVGEIGKWLGSINDMAKKHAETRAAKDPRADELDTRERNIQEKETASYDRAIGTEVNRSNNSAMSKVVEPLFTTLKLPNDGRREFVNALQSRIWKAMKEDKIFQRQAHAIKAKGDAERTAQFISAKFAELLPDNFRRLRNDVYPNLPAAPAPGTKQKPAAVAANGKGAPVFAKVSSVDGQRPKREDVDWLKTDELQFITGKSVTLKNGKRISFDWNKV